MKHLKYEEDTSHRNCPGLGPSLSRFRKEQGLAPFTYKNAKCLNCEKTFEAVYQNEKRIQFLCYLCRSI